MGRTISNKSMNLKKSVQSRNKKESYFRNSLIFRASYRDRTNDLLITSQLLYHLS